MLNLKFKDYMETNAEFNYLKAYYNSIDFTAIYGVERMEIKHNNFLKWLFESNKNMNEKTIDYFPIRRLLKILQRNNQYYDYLNSINIGDATIENVKVTSENQNFDLLITLKINDENFIIAIENQLESFLSDDQLETYKDMILNNYKSCKTLFVSLHSGFENRNNSNYIPITYQELYDDILKKILDFSNDAKIKLILSYYINCLSSYSTDKIQSLIITDQEKNCLKSIFKDEQVLKMIYSLYKKENDEYTSFFYKNKKIFIQIFRKYDTLYTNNDKLSNKVSKGKIDYKKFNRLVSEFDNNLSKKIKKIIIDKTYIFDDKHFNDVGKLLKEVFNTLLKKYKFEELNDLVNLYPKSVPLLIEKNKINELKTKTHKNWYLNNPEIILIDRKTYYILSTWTLSEYEDLKEKINNLNLGIIIK